MTPPVPIVYVTAAPPPRAALPLVVPSAVLPPPPRARATPEPKLVLRAGTQIGVELMQDISSKHAAIGDLFRFIVLDDIHVDGRVVVPQNTEGIGVVAEANAAGKHDKPGSLLLEARELHLAGGPHVQVMIDRRMAELQGAGSKGLPWYATMAGRFIPQFGMMQTAYTYLKSGKDISFEKGTVFIVMTIEDTLLAPLPEIRRNQARASPLPGDALRPAYPSAPSGPPPTPAGGA